MDNSIKDFDVINELCKIDTKMAKFVLEDDDLPTKRLAQILENSICGNIRDIESKEILKLPNEVVMAGLLKLINNI